MIVVKKKAEVREYLDSCRAAGRTVGMVGTSGGTHEGHLSLVARARQECDVVAVFWNGALKLEWAPGAVQNYARDLDREVAQFEAAGVDTLYVPLREDLYDRTSLTVIEMPTMSAHLTGMPESGHMHILVTMVATLLNIAGPCTTYFGEKDWQQLVMFQRMAEDLLLPSRVVGCPTLREPDGVAISSRNSRLTAAQRADAPRLYQALSAAVEAITAGERDAATITGQVLDLLRAVSVPDYVVAVDAATLEPLERLRGEVRLLACATFGSTPLVDNIGVTIADTPSTQGWPGPHAARTGKEAL
jgi:pantoate--beta-alanine ligase